MPSSPSGGDPFSHPSGASVSRPVRVPDQPASWRRQPPRRTHPPPGPPGARKRSVPSRVHSVGSNEWLAPPGWRHVQRLADSRLGRITINTLGLPAARVWAGGDQPLPFSPEGSGVQTLSPVHGQFPRKLLCDRARRPGRRQRAHLLSSHARRPWPVCRPAPWWR